MIVGKVAPYCAILRVVLPDSAPLSLAIRRVERRPSSVKEYILGTRNKGLWVLHCSSLTGILFFGGSFRLDVGLNSPQIRAPAGPIFRARMCQPHALLFGRSKGPVSALSILLLDDRKRNREGQG